MTAPDGRASHWDAAYRTRGADGVSWFQVEPEMSLHMIHVLDTAPSTAVIDVGGGASVLVDHLIAEGFADVSVLDVSGVALDEGRRRLDGVRGVTWLHRDMLRWRPTRHFGLWHDRAVFHFLTEEIDRARYMTILLEALESDAGLVMATFAEDGPVYCSGLPVARYSVEELVDVLGTRFSLVGAERELHRTPDGTIQPFTWVAGVWR